MKPVLLLYFVRRIASMVMLIWLSLVLLLILLELLRGNGETMTDILLSVLLKSPRLAMEILPFACALGSAIAMRRMVGEGAMPVLRTSGLSPTAIVGFQLAAALPFFLAYIALSEVLLPGGADAARVLENRSSAIHGLWLKDGSNFIRAQAVTTAGTMQSVVIYHTDGDQLTGITRAREASYHEERWQLQGIEQLDNQSGRLTRRTQTRLNWQLPIKPSSFNAFTKRPRDMSVWEATQAALELSSSGQYHHDLYKSIWRRWLTLPALFLLVALGVCFIGSGNRQQRYAMSLPVLWALLCCSGYMIASDLFIQTAALSDTPLLLILPPLALVGYIAYSIRRAERV